jgi:hypothetical protein
MIIMTDDALVISIPTNDPQALYAELLRSLTLIDRELFRSEDQLNCSHKSIYVYKDFLNHLINH